MGYLHFKPGLALGQALTELAEDLHCDYDPVILMLVGTGLEAYAIAGGNREYYAIAGAAIREACSRIGIPINVEEFKLEPAD